MSDKEYKSYDSSCYIEYHNARLAMDPDIKEGKDDLPPMVRLKVVATSKNEERFDELWLEVNVGAFNAEAAQFLKKGDTLSLRGRAALRTWGDDNEKSTVCVERAELFIPVALFMELKERGFGGAGGGAKKKDAGKGKSSSKPSGKPSGKPQGKVTPKKVVEIPDDEDEATDDEDSDEE